MTYGRLYYVVVMGLVLMGIVGGAFYEVHRIVDALGQAVHV